MHCNSRIKIEAMIARNSDNIPTGLCVEAGLAERTEMQHDRADEDHIRGAWSRRIDAAGSRPVAPSGPVHATGPVDAIGAGERPARNALSTTQSGFEHENSQHRP